MGLTQTNTTARLTEKLLYSDWLRAVQFKCNTGQKVQHQWKLHIVILDYDWLKDGRKFSKPVVCKGAWALGTRLFQIEASRALKSL